MCACARLHLVAARGRPGFPSPHFPRRSGLLETELAWTPTATSRWPTTLT